MILMPVHRLGRRFIAAAAGGLAALLITAALAPVAALSPDPVMSGGLFGQNQVLRYRWGGSPPVAMKTAIGAGVNDANTTRRSKAPTFSYDATGASTVYYGIDVPCGINGLACMRRSVPNTFGVWFRENGHRYDWGTLRWCELSGSPDGCYEVENVMLDELGHVMGLDHHVNLANDSDYLDAVVQTYSRAKPRAGWNAHAFGRCDVATLQQQYDVASATTLYSTCLDVPTSLSLTASGTAVTAGSTVAFTATLKSAGSGRLSDNAIAGRTVVLQNRTAAGWVDVAPMTPGSVAGTYTVSRTLWTGVVDYRALFRKPGGEGLRTSGSTAVTVIVTPPCMPRQCVLAASSAR
jgi:hypothetical protein